MDGALNEANFYVQKLEHPNHTLKTNVWVALSQKLLHNNSTSKTRWSDFQKKIGFASFVCTQSDVTALNTNPVAYRLGDTPRSMFLMTLLLDELNFEDTSKFREI